MSMDGMSAYEEITHLDYPIPARMGMGGLGELLTATTAIKVVLGVGVLYLIWKMRQGESEVSDIEERLADIDVDPDVIAEQREREKKKNPINRVEVELFEYDRDEDGSFTRTMVTKTMSIDEAKKKIKELQRKGYEKREFPMSISTDEGGGYTLIDPSKKGGWKFRFPKS